MYAHTLTKRDEEPKASSGGSGAGRKFFVGGNFKMYVSKSPTIKTFTQTDDFTGTAQSKPSKTS